MISGVSGPTALLRPARAAALLLFAIAPLAYAQSTDSAAPAPADSTLPAVKVTAESDKDQPYGVTKGYVARDTTAGKTSTSLLETPASVSVVTRDQMDQQNAQTLNAAVRYVSGVTPETRGGIATRYDMLKVRGFDADKYWNGLKLLDNQWYATPQIDTYLMDRVEVLKGPVSVLYGQAAAGGLLEQESKLPTVEPLHEVGIEFGNYAHKQATFDFSGPIADDSRYLYRLTGIARSEDGQVQSTKNERIAIAPSFTWRPDNKTSLTLFTLYQHDPKSTAYGSVPPQGTVLYDPYGKLPSNFYDGDTSFESFNRVQESVGYKFERKLNNAWTVRSNGRLFHLAQDYKSVYGSALEDDLRTLDRGTAASKDNLNTVQFDNQIEGNVVTGPIDHTLLFGFDYQHYASNFDAGFGTAPSLDIFAPNNHQAITPPDRYHQILSGTQYGVYAQDQARWGNVVLTLGAREDWASSSSNNTTYNEYSSQFDRAFTYRAGLSYVFNNGFAPYVSYTQSFTPQAGTDINGKQFDPERGHQYEVGLKFQPKGFNAMFTAALFQLTRSNLLTIDATNPNFQSQSGEARTRGVELEAKVSLTNSLDVAASYTYLNTIYTKDNGGLEGKHLPAVPQNEASLWAYYTIDRGPLAGLSLGAGGRYTGQTYSSDNSFKLQSFFLVDATARYDLGRAAPQLKGAELYVNAQNLFNKSYVASCYYGSWCAFGYGRQVFAGMNYHW
ncbi:TonB-dependent siderophore receptor [Caballeronia sp. BR00000012568055]|uniref:TonB-dependent siderophore receptor n=1 Tax=Caballeronia sp. BR00000012568055 TaxID=2918761 RepID=UPI0023F64FAA|nr:TonB-dependent siderophore receptor [Caballeronia sp. BR00000012568055]